MSLGIGEFRTYEFEDIKNEEEEQGITQHIGPSLNQIYEKRLEQIENMKEPRVCIRCCIAYTELGNFSWNCLYHPGAIDKSVGKYDCCGMAVREDWKKASLYGCKRCDHSSIDFDPRDNEPTQKIPFFLIRHGIIKLEKNCLNVIKRSIDDYGEGWVTVTRKQKAGPY